MFEGFEVAMVETEETVIRVRRGGSGPLRLPAGPRPPGAGRAARRARHHPDRRDLPPRRYGLRSRLLGLVLPGPARAPAGADDRRRPAPARGPRPRYLVGAPGRL